MPEVQDRIEKLGNSILSDAQKKAEEIISKAQQQADELTEQAREQYRRRKRGRTRQTEDPYSLRKGIIKERLCRT